MDPHFSSQTTFCLEIALIFHSVHHLMLAVVKLTFCLSRVHSGSLNPMVTAFVEVLFFYFVLEEMVRGCRVVQCPSEMHLLHLSRGSNSALILSLGIRRILHVCDVMYQGETNVSSPWECQRRV